MVRTLVFAGAVALWAIAPAHSEDMGATERGREGTTGSKAGTSAGTASGGSAMAIDAARLAKDPADHYGKMVQLEAEVADVYGTTGFSLDEDTTVAGPDILVIAPRLENVEADAPVTVRGRVRKLSTSELEREYDWFKASSMDQDVLTRFEDRPVIVADSVESSSGRQLVVREKSGTAAGDAPERPKIPGTDYEIPSMPGR